MNQSEWAQAVKDKDGGACRICGATDDLHAHHIVPRALGGGSTLDNGMTLCVKHHQGAHRGTFSAGNMTRPVQYSGLHSQVSRHAVSNKELADALGVHHNTVTNWFRGGSDLTIVKIFHILMTLGYDKEEILDMRLSEIL